MALLPTGTVTLLFSDMEGSTRLLDRLGGSYASALDDQRRIQREAWDSHGGVELGTEGDSFYVVFRTAQQAIAAAIEVQRALQQHTWPEDTRIAVRIGIHTGAPQRHGDAYVGMDVHRAARVAAAAHGGQVLVSAATAALLEGDREGVELRDLGAFRLKDIPRSERLYQVIAPGLPRDFPPPRAMGSTSTLPVPATPLIGRDGELALLTDALLRRESRVVTLTGPGGTGKTRLAIGVANAAAAHFTDGVYFVALENVTTRESTWAEIAASLNLSPDRVPIEAVPEHLAHRDVLLVLDNLEQAPDAADVVQDLIHAAPDLRVLATSRTPLHLIGEREHAVPPLEPPASDGVAAARASGAVALFVHHGQLVRRDFDLTPDNVSAVVAICERLDRLPLAIELAAARLKLMSPQALLSRLDGALDLRATDTRRPDRQQTLRQAIEWSYRLLNRPQQRVLRLLAVLPAGADLDTLFDLTTATATAVDEPVDVFALAEALADASLVRVTEDDDGQPRLTLLNTVRVFAIQALTDAGEVDVVHQALLDHVHQLVTSLDPHADAPTRDRHRQHMATELPTLRYAAGWVTGLSTWSDHDTTWIDHQLEIIARTIEQLHMQRRHDEAQRLGTRAHQLGSNGSALAQADLALEMADLAMTLGDASTALRLVDEADARLAATDLDSRYGRSRASMEASIHHNRSFGAREAGDLAGARAELETTIRLSQLDSVRTVSAMLSLAVIDAFEGRAAQALQLESAAADLADEIGHVKFALNARGNMACSLRELGRPDEALRQFQAIGAEVLSVGDPRNTVSVAEDVACVLIALERLREAGHLLGAVEALRRRTGLTRPQVQEREIAPVLELAQQTSPDAWAAYLAEGRALELESTFRRVLGLDDSAEPVEPTGARARSGT